LKTMKTASRTGKSGWHVGGAGVPPRGGQESRKPAKKPTFSIISRRHCALF